MKDKKNAKRQPFLVNGVDPEKLAKDIIGRFNLARKFQRKIVYTAKDIPALKRANAADRKRLKGLDGESPEATRLREAIRARAWKVEELTKREGATVTDMKTEYAPDGRGVCALEAYLRANWTIREITIFKDFTHGGTYDAGKGWRINFAGYVADTAEEQKNLIGVFEGLCYEAYFFMGMKKYAEMGADVPPAFGWTRFAPGNVFDPGDEFDPDEEKSPFDMTLNALICSIPAKSRK